ncbi:MAG: right-handed parallel beta-helix repeat-containing protein, partial [Candidatus Thorarchaeota archaeon]
SKGLVLNNTLEYNGNAIDAQNSSDIEFNGNRMWECDNGLDDDVLCTGFTIVDNLFAFCHGNGLVLAGSDHFVVGNIFVHSVVEDGGTNNYWDDGVLQGNLWSDYSGAGWYFIGGPAGSYDHHPQIYDPIFPMITHPGDLELDFYQTGDAVAWRIYDVDPGGYRILRNGTVAKSGVSYNPDDDFWLSLDGLLVGHHNITIDYWDDANHHVFDTVWVTKTDVLPTITHPTDVAIDEGDEEYSITWLPSHAHPSHYEVKRNGTLFASGSWEGGSITIELFDFPPGVWDVMMTVWAVSGAQIGDSIIISVNSRSDLTPVIVGEESLEVPENTEGYSLTWTVHGSYPSSYSIYRDQVLVITDTPASRAISFDVPVGMAGTEHYYELVVSDSYGHSAKHNVTVVYIAAVTTAPPPPPPDATLAGILAGGAGIVLFVGVVIVLKRRRKPLLPEVPIELVEEIPPYEEAIAEPALVPDTEVQVLRGAQFVGNRFRYKVKVVNNSPSVITDVTVTISSFPRDSLNLEGDISKIVPKIDPKGFRSPSFEFLPTQDCVKGNIVASVSYVDHSGQVHSMTTEPYTIRAVCDLLSPESITPEDYKLRITEFEHGEASLKVDDWTPEQMHEKTVRILKNTNFYEVESSTTKVGEHTETRIIGWAAGKYTGKNIGVDIIITGRPGVAGATCRVRMSGEDEAMIMPAIDEISQKLSAWLCPMCAGSLPAEFVNELKAGRTVACPFCGVTMDR